MIPFRIVGRVPLFSPYYDEKEKTMTYPLNPATIPSDHGIYFLVRWIECGKTFDLTKKIGVHHSDWSFLDIEYKGDLRIPEVKDEKLVNTIEDIRTGIPDEHGAVECGFNMLYSRDNGENYPVPARATLRPPYEELEDLVIYKDQIGKNVLPLEKSENSCKLIFRLDTIPPIFRYINDGKIRGFSDEVIEPRPYWARDKIGLTGLPLILSDKSKLFILHGFETSDKIYKYSMGVATWKSGNWKISENPILTPKIVRKKIIGATNTADEKWEFGELKPWKEVIYSDAIIPKNKENAGTEDLFNVDKIESIYMPINLGDMAEVVVELYMEDLLKFSKSLI
jgi:hypothetical protein